MAMNEDGGGSAKARATDSSPASIERFFQRYADDALLFRVLMRFWGTDRPLDGVGDLAVPLGVHASHLRKSLHSLVLEGFVTGLEQDGETTYMLTRDQSARLIAGQVLRAAIDRGMCK